MLIKYKKDMKNFIIAISAILPTFLSITVGYVAKKMNILSDKAMNLLNKFVSKVLLTCLMVSNILAIELDDFWDTNLFILNVLVLFVEFFIFKKIITRIDKNKNKSTSIINSVIRSNYLVFGSSIALSYYGYLPKSFSFVSLVFLPITTFLILINLQNNLNEKVRLKTLFRAIADPLILFSIITIIIKCLNIKIPKPIVTSINNLGITGTTLALISLGTFITFEKVKKNIKQIVTGVVLRYTIALIVLIIAVILNFRGERLMAIVFTFASSTANVTYPLSIEYKSDSDVAGNLVVFTSIFSLVFIAITIYLFASLNLI